MSENDAKVYEEFEKIRSEGEDYLLEVINNGDISITTVNKEGLTPFLLAVDEGYSDDCIKELIDKGSDINHQDHLGNTALHYAAMVGYKLINQNIGW